MPRYSIIISLSYVARSILHVCTSVCALFVTRVFFRPRYFLSHTHSSRCSLLRIINRFLSLSRILSPPLSGLSLSLSLVLSTTADGCHCSTLRERDFPRIFSTYYTTTRHLRHLVPPHLSRLLSPRYANLPLHHISLACSHQAAGGGLVEVDGSALGGPHGRPRDPTYTGGFRGIGRYFGGERYRGYHYTRRGDRGEGSNTRPFIGKNSRYLILSHVETLLFLEFFKIDIPLKKCVRCINVGKYEYIEKRN